MNDDLYNRANAVDIVALISNTMTELKPYGSDRLGSTSCPICNKVSAKNNIHFVVTLSKNVFFCFVCDSGGGPVRFTMDYHGMNNKEAIQEILGEDSDTSQSERTYQVRKEQLRKAAEIDKVKQQALFTALDLIYIAARDAFKRDGENKYYETLSYLEDERCIPQYVIQEAIEASMIAFLPDNPEQARALITQAVPEHILIQSGLKKEGKRHLAIQFRPILFPYFNADGLVTSMEFRKFEGDKYGSKSIRYGKAYLPWLWVRGKFSTTVVLEGCIDGLSMAAIDSDCNIMGIPGIRVFEDGWLDIDCLKESKDVPICFDNDPNPILDRKAKPLGTDSEGNSLYPPLLDDDGHKIYPGEKAAKDLAEKMQQKGIHAYPNIPKVKGQDANSFLQAFIRTKMENQ